MTEELEVKEAISEERIQEIILEILSGEKHIKQEYSKSIPRIIKFIYPTASSRQYCELLEEDALEEAKNEGLPLEEDMCEELQLRLFSTEDMENLQELQTKREGFLKLLKKRIKGTDIYKRDLQRLEELDLQIQELNHKRQMIREYTAEYSAQEDKYFELLAKSTFSLDGVQLWENSSELLSSLTADEAYPLLNSFLEFYWGYNTKTMREVARSSQWRTMYLSSEKGSRLTEVPAKDLPIAYLHLMSWSMFYQSIYDMLPSDRPSEETIEDDERLDQFLDRYQQRVQKETSNLSKNSTNSRHSILDKDQVVVTAESKNYISLHKSDGYSDTAIISGRVNEDIKGDTSYSEVREKRTKIRERAAKKRERIKKRGIN
jgi:hypothetical protein